MSKVEVEPGGVTVLMTRAEAEEVTLKLKQYMGMTCHLAKEAHDKQAWKAMGYGSWAAYCTAEFDVSRSYAYRLMGHVNKILELSAVAGLPAESPIGDSLTEGATRNLDMEAAKEVAAATAAGMPDATDAEKAQAVAEAVKSPAVAAVQRARADKMLAENPDLSVMELSKAAKVLVEVAQEARTAAQPVDPYADAFRENARRQTGQEGTPATPPAPQPHGERTQHGDAPEAGTDADTTASGAAGGGGEPVPPPAPPATAPAIGDLFDGLARSFAPLLDMLPEEAADAVLALDDEDRACALSTADDLADWLHRLDAAIREQA